MDIAGLPAEGLKAIAAIGTAIIGVAVIAVIVGTKSNTANVISAGGNALSTDIGAAVAPVSSNATAVSQTPTPTNVQPSPLGALSNPAPVSNPTGGGSYGIGNTLPSALNLGAYNPSNANAFNSWADWSGANPSGYDPLSSGIAQWSML